MAQDKIVRLWCMNGGMNGGCMCDWVYVCVCGECARGHACSIKENMWHAWAWKLEGVNPIT